MNNNWLNQLIGDYTPYRFKLIDYLFAGIVGLISLGTYIMTLTPSVSAGDNGELTSAIFFLGLGHAPGYPIHSLFGKIFTFLPINNIGWRANFYSAASTSFSVILAYLMFLKLVSSLSKNHWYAIVAATIGALSLAFSQVLWGQSITTEVYAISAIFYPLLSLVILKWFDQVYSRQGLTHPYFGENYLLAFAFIFGVGLGGHQTLAITEFFFGGLVAFGLLFFQILPRKDFEQKLSSGIFHFIGVMILVAVAWYVYLSYIVSLKVNLFANNYDNLKTGVWIFVICNIALLAYYLLNKLTELRNPATQDTNNSFKRLALFTVKFFGMMFLGLFVYLYLFIRSHGSPPINWGGIDQSVDWWGKIAKFFTMINRKQFAPNSINPSLGVFYYQSLAFLKEIAYEQFTLPLWGLITLGVVELYRKSKLFLIWLLVGFFTFSLQLILYINYDIPNIDLFFIEVFFIFSYFMLAAFIPFGLMFLFEGVEWILTKTASTKHSSTESSTSS